MDQPATKSPLSAHPADEVRIQRQAAPIVRGLLYNQGLTDSGCATAYFAAHWATGGNRELAWEAARRHQLQMLGDAIDIVPTGRDARSDRDGMTSLELQRRRTARQELIDATRALVNPHTAQAADVIQRGNSDLERAA